MISACVSGSKTKVDNIKYLASSKVFLLSIERTKIESDQMNKKINSICRFDFVDKVKSKNIDQGNKGEILNLIGIDYLKNKDDYEINLIFDKNSHIVFEPETHAEIICNPSWSFAIILARYLLIILIFLF